VWVGPYISGSAEGRPGSGGLLSLEQRRAARAAAGCRVECEVLNVSSHPCQKLLHDLRTVVDRRITSRALLSAVALPCVTSIHRGTGIGEAHAGRVGRDVVIGLAAGVGGDVLDRYM
jgi:hypothetical protein